MKRWGEEALWGSCICFALAALWVHPAVSLCIVGVYLWAEALDRLGC